MTTIDRHRQAASAITIHQSMHSQKHPTTAAPTPPTPLPIKKHTNRSIFASCSSASTLASSSNPAALKALGDLIPAASQAATWLALAIPRRCLSTACATTSHGPTALQYRALMVNTSAFRIQSTCSSSAVGRIESSPSIAASFSASASPRSTASAIACRNGFEKRFQSLRSHAIKAGHTLSHSTALLGRQEQMDTRRW